MITLNTIESSLHNIEIQNAAGNALAIDGSGKLNVKIEDDGNSITIDGTVAATQSGTWDIGTLTTITNDVNIADGGNSITVDAIDLDIRDLTHVSDSMKVGDGTDFLAVNADGSINTNAAPAGFATWQVTQQTIDTSVGGTELASTPLAARLKIEVQNLGSNDLFVKEATGVTSVNGLKIPKGGSFEQMLDDTANIFAITSSSTTDVRIAEYAA